MFLNGLNVHDQHRDMRLDIDNMSYEVSYCVLIALMYLVFFFPPVLCSHYFSVRIFHLRMLSCSQAILGILENKILVTKLHKDQVCIGFLIFLHFLVLSGIISSRRKDGYCKHSTN